MGIAGGSSLPLPPRRTAARGGDATLRVAPRWGRLRNQFRPRKQTRSAMQPRRVQPLRTARPRARNESPSFDSGHHTPAVGGRPREPSAPRSRAWPTPFRPHSEPCRRTRRSAAAAKETRVRAGWEELGAPAALPFACVAGRRAANAPLAAMRARGRCVQPAARRVSAMQSVDVGESTTKSACDG